MNEQAKGNLIILISSLFFGSYGVWSRLIGNSIDNFTQVWTRGLLIIALLIPIGIVTRTLKRIDRKDWKWVLIYTLFGAVAVAPFFYAANTIGVGASTLLFYASYTLMSYLLGYFFFKENLGGAKVISLILAIVGLGLLFDISFRSGQLLGAACAIIAGSGGAIEVVFTKKISQKYSAVQISLILWVVIFLLHFALSLLIGSPLPSVSPTLPWIAVAGYGLSSLAAFYLVTVGYKYVEPSVGSIIGLMEIIFGVIFGVIIFSESVTLGIIIGTLLITAAAALPNVNGLFQSKRYN